MEVQWGILLEQAKNDDQTAFEELYRNSYNAVYRTVKSMVKEEETVMDIVQESFVKGFASLSSLENPDTFPYWIRQIATNKARDWFRKRQDVLLFDMEDEEGNLPEFEDENPDHSPDAVMDREETTRLIDEILGTLSDEQRIAIGMYYYEDMRVPEIAKFLGVSENTVKSRLNYGRKKIKACVEELEKKGTKLYSLAPIPFFIWLLRIWRSQTASGNAPASLFSNIMAQSTASAGKAASGASSGGAAKTAKTAAKAAKAAKDGHFASLVVKIVAGVIAVALVGGGIAAVVHFTNRGGSESAGKPTGEVTGGQTGEVTGEPTSEPSGEPTNEPTGEPTVEAGSEGLKYTLNTSRSGYSVSIGTCKDTDIIIPSEHENLPVTAIYTNAFRRCKDVTSVKIPDSVTKIGDYAFSGSGLISISIPGSVTEIGQYAFNSCESLTDVTLCEGVSHISSYAFNNCDALTSVTLPGSLEGISKCAFANCTGLQSITISDGLKYIDSEAFSHCDALASIALPDSIERIGWKAFAYTSLETVTIPGSVEEISSWAFGNCTSLTNVTILGGVQTIGVCAFEDCTSLTDITIPASVTRIEDSAFDNNLQNIHFGGTMEDWKAIRGAYFGMGGGDYTVYCTDGSLEEHRGILSFW